MTIRILILGLVVMCFQFGYGQEFYFNKSNLDRYLIQKLWKIDSCNENGIRDTITYFVLENNLFIGEDRKSIEAIFGEPYEKYKAEGYTYIISGVCGISKESKLYHEAIESTLHIHFDNDKVSKIFGKLY